MAARIVETLSAVSHLLKWCVGYDDFSLGSDQDFPHRAKSSNKWIGEDHWDVPKIVLWIKTSLVGGKAIGQMIAEEAIGDCLGLERRDVWDSFCCHRLFLLSLALDASPITTIVLHLSPISYQSDYVQVYTWA